MFHDRTVIITSHSKNILNFKKKKFLYVFCRPGFEIKVKKMEKIIDRIQIINYIKTQINIGSKTII